MRAARLLDDERVEWIWNGTLIQDGTVGMSNYMGIALYIFVGSIGGLIGLKLKMPGGVLTCSVFSIIILKTFMKTQWNMPGEFSFIAQVLVGVMVADAYHPEMLKTIKLISLPAITSSFMLIGAGGLLAVIIHRLHLLDAATAYLATSPGAITSLVAISTDGAANPVVVSCFHLVRLLLILATAPWIFKALSP